MSADNYYIIKHHPKGGYAAVEAFASIERATDVRDEHYSFPRSSQAYAWAASQNPEYGVRYDTDINVNEA